jgi:OOP family OmpA-OmpF porin
VRHLYLATLCGLALGCASTPYHQPIAVQPVVPGSDEIVAVEHLALAMDSSGTIDWDDHFAGEKALFEALVASLPDGDYAVSSVVFGGHDRERLALAPFDRSALTSHAHDASYLGEGTPFIDVFDEIREEGAEATGRTAVVLLSDGAATNAAGHDVEPESVVAAASALAESRGGDACFHTIQVGDNEAGGALLEQIAAVTDCGSSTSADALRDASSIQAFTRAALLGPAPIPPAPPVVDADGDGVLDTADECPGTPKGASVDERGCWVVRGLTFAPGSAEIESAGKARLDSEVVPVLESNPGVRVRVDGHTDSSGSASLNQRLSDQRADAVREYLVSAGIDAERLESKGFGEDQPIASNDTREGMSENRRTEITVIR